MSQQYDVISTNHGNYPGDSDIWTLDGNIAGTAIFDMRVKR